MSREPNNLPPGGADTVAPPAPEGLELFIVSDHGLSTVKLVVGSTYVLGRESEADIVVRDASVSRRHAQLTVTSEGARLVDLGGRNGTRVAGTPLKQGVSTDIRSAASPSSVRPRSSCSARVRQHTWRHRPRPNRPPSMSRRARTNRWWSTEECSSSTRCSTALRRRCSASSFWEKPGSAKTSSPARSTRAPRARAHRSCN